MEITIDTRQIPNGYLYCFISECPLHENCLRWLAWKQNRQDEHWGFAVFPAAIRMAKCPHYRKAETKLMAWGFNALFENVLAKHEKILRSELKDYLGGNGTYSRYKRGLRMLTPEQQKHIISLFRSYGYKDVQFDHYTNVYDFDH